MTGLGGVSRSEFSLRSEFGWVVVRLDTQGNGPRLRIHSPRSGRTILLDPLEAESLTQWRHDELTSLVLGRPYADSADEPGSEEPCR